MLKEWGRYPIDTSLEAIAVELQNKGRCLVKAEPGAGKTTRLPPYLLKSCKNILVLDKVLNKLAPAPTKTGLGSSLI